LLLTGELGSGKTTLVRGIARGLRAGGDISSPTFQLVRIHAANPQLAHVDIYRLDRQADLAALGLDELLADGVVVVEWGAKLRKPLAALNPTRSGEIEFTHVDAHTRRLRIVSGPNDWSF
jgi:tRNA threonylcarbamoyladenosine biosynthesis protein TsaE